VTETESRPRNRALVASFLFTDLVGYSKGTASDQYAAKATLSEILGRNLATLRKDDYRIKDTGDGALIAFLSSPEHALYVALAIAHDFAHAASAAGFPSNNVRTGLHIGAVKEAIDLESRPNFVGDGINAAQRIMDFAAPGQITASRAYFEAVSWLDSAYAALFQHLGASNDKHGRPHELYAIAPSDGVLEKLRRDLESARRDDARDEAALPVPPPQRKADAATLPGSTPEAHHGAASSGRRWYAPIGALIAVVVAASIFVAMRAQAPSDASVHPVESKIPAAAPAGSSSAPAATTATAPPADAQPASAAPKPESAAPSAAAPRAEPAPVARTAPDVNSPPASASRAAPSTRPSPSNAGVDTQRKATETPAAPVAATTSAAPASARCRHILEKVQVGEPLSQDEKRELASSCR
jgi:class 3 adenylate cyclase